MPLIRHYGGNEQRLKKKKRGDFECLVRKGSIIFRSIPSLSFMKCTGTQKESTDGIVPQRAVIHRLFGPNDTTPLKLRRKNGCALSTAPGAPFVWPASSSSSSVGIMRLVGIAHGG